MLTASDATLAAVSWFSGPGRVAGLVVADGSIHRCDAAGKNDKGDAAYLPQAALVSAKAIIDIYR